MSKDVMIGEPIEDELDGDDGGIFAGSAGFRHFERQQEMCGPKPDGYKTIAICVCGQKVLVEFTWEEVLQEILGSLRRATTRVHALYDACLDYTERMEFHCTACNHALKVQGAGMRAAALAAENGWIEAERWQRFVAARDEILDERPKEELAKVDLLAAVAKAVDKHGAEAVSKALGQLAPSLPLPPQPVPADDDEEPPPRDPEKDGELVD